jgi:hypothetical protein
MREGSTSFFTKKEAKNFFSSGAWAVSPPAPMAQIKKSFLVLFFKKELLALAFSL